MHRVYSFVQKYMKIYMVQLNVPNFPHIVTECALVVNRRFYISSVITREYTKMYECNSIFE